MLRSAVLLLGIAIAVWVRLLPEDAAPHHRTLLTLIAILLFLWGLIGFGPLGHGRVNVLSVLALVLSIIVGFVVSIWLLSFIIGPLPIVAMAIILAIVLTILMITRPSERRRQQLATSGKCPECGYDLRASETRCPECGADLPEEIARRRRIAAELLAKRYPPQDQVDQAEPEEDAPPPHPQ